MSTTVVSPKSCQPLVSAGLAAYNRPDFLRRSLDCLTRQSYPNIEIIVSDDCSPGDGTSGLVREFMRRDSRIRYCRQTKNLGSFANYRTVFELAVGEYFFWADEDDEWHPDFVATGVRALEANPRCRAWCCTMNNIDSYGRVIRSYPGFSRFASTNSRARDIVRFLHEPEVMGKSNLFHGIYRRSALCEVVREYSLNEAWGSDYCFALAFLARFDLAATDEVLHYKRVVRPSDTANEIHPIVVPDPSRHVFPLCETSRYMRENYRAVRSTPYRWLVVVVVCFRVLLVLRNAVLDAAQAKLVEPVGQTKAKLAGAVRRIRAMWQGLRRLTFYDLYWRWRFRYHWEPKTVDVRWARVETRGVITVPLGLIRTPLVTPVGNRPFLIEETPHYRWIKALVEGREDTGCRAAYREYLGRFFPEEDADKGVSDVITLVVSLRSQCRSDGSITIVTQPPRRERGVGPIVEVFDGVHRCAVAKALNHTQVQCRLVSGVIAVNPVVVRTISRS